MSRIWIIAAALIAGAPAAAEPITSAIQPPLPGGSIAVIERGRVEVATDGPLPEDADETTLVATTMISAAPHDRVTITATVDLLWRSAELSAPGGGRVERTASGIGDLTVLAASPLEITAQLIAAPFVGVKIPTGQDDRADDFGRLPQRLQVGTGAFDVPAGVLVRLRDEALSLYGVATYTLATEANEFDAGDSLRWDLAAQRSITPAGAPVDLEACLETRLLWRAADSGRRAPSESGGLSWYVSPGLRARFDRHAVETAVELPFTQPFDQHVDYVIYLAYRLLVN